MVQLVYNVWECLLPVSAAGGISIFHFPFSVFIFPMSVLSMFLQKNKKNPLILKGYAYQYRIMGRTPIKKEIENHENQDYNSNSGNRNHIDGCRQQPCLWRGLDVSKGIWGLHQL
jgi:hypothetical protein